MKKILILSLIAGAVVILLLVLPAMSTDDAYVFWYSYGDVYLSGVREKMTAAMTGEGLHPIHQDSNGLQQTQTDQINTALVSGASAIVINVCESGSIGVAENLLNAVRAYNLPCIFFNRAISTDDSEAKALIDSYDKAVFIGTLFDQAGKMQGDMIGKYVLDHYDEIDLNGDGVISYVLFKGDEANQEAIYRTRYGIENANALITAAGKPPLAFYDAGNAAGYLVDLNGTWSNTAAFEYMTTILAQYNEVNGNMVELVIANNDDMALGAVNALTVAGYNTGDPTARTIPVFGVDATDAAKELIAQGRMAGTIKQDAQGMADAVARVTANLVQGKSAFEGLSNAYTFLDQWMVAIPYAVYTGE